jgi:hypothetical protein
MRFDAADFGQKKLAVTKLAVLHGLFHHPLPLR